MQYLVVFTPKKSETGVMPSDFQEMEVKEEAQARDLYADGGLRRVWALDTEEKGATVLFEADSPEKLQEMIDSFPFVQADYVDHLIFPLAPYPAFAYPAFAYPAFGKQS